MAQKRGMVLSGFFLGLALMAGGNLLSCSSKTVGTIDPEIVAGFNAGIVRRTDPLKVAFVREQDISRNLSPAVFRMKPAVQGDLSWENAFTLVFTPLEALKPGLRYMVTVGGKELDMEPFSFEVEAAYPSIDVSFDPVRIDDAGEALIGGYLEIDEECKPALIERVINSAKLGRPKWDHLDGRHYFSFPPVKQEKSRLGIEVSWNGQPVGSRDEGSATVYIPGQEIFTVTEFRQARGMVEAVFSSPLKRDQDLRGFVTLEGESDIRCSLEGNVIKIFGIRNGSEVMAGMELVIRDLENINGIIMETPVQYTIAESWELPEVRFTGSGTILPTSQGTTMALETRNLSGVLVEAFRIYGDNLLQFLQVNDLEGTNELYRVGEPVWTKAFNFPWKSSDQNRWTRQGLDLSELARKYPDGMFRIRVSFRPRHIHYECTARHGDFSQLEFPGDTMPAYTSDGEQSYWDFYDTYSDDFYYNQKDPCHPVFYYPSGGHNITVGRNVLVSDLGLLAKKSLSGKWLIAASNVKTAKPLGNVDVDVLNLQGRVLARVKTGNDGMVSLPDLDGAEFGGGKLSAGTPAFITAKANIGRAYLKINDSQALAISHFDLAGDKPLDGIRGLIYGERGVWRPGDEIYLTFLLSDPANTLPEDHPVSFELEDPRGRVTARKTYTSSVDGFYAIAASTQGDALTGDWTARVRVGGNVFTKNLKIETVIPNRLKMDLDFGSKPYLEGERIPVSLEAAWLYGAPAPGLKADISVLFNDKDTVFTSYSDYSFRDPSRNVSGERQTLYEGTLNGAGKAAFNMELKPGSSVPGKVNARFFTRVFEPSGIFSSESVSKEFSPYRRYVGLKLPKGDSSRGMLLTDVEHEAEIVLVDGEGKPSPENVSLDCAVYKLSWRWWWEKGANEAADFASALSRTPIMKETVTSSRGRASWKFQVKHPDWGRYLVIARDSAGGHAAASVVYIDWPGWAGRAQDKGQGASAMLTLSAEKPSYKAGEKIALTFPSNPEASAMVAVEKGGQILKSEWINCAENQTRYEFTTDPSMVPNIYVHVTLVQPHLQTQNDLPLRLYGIIPIMVDDPATRLSPQIGAPETWRPESQVSFTVSEAAGRPMVYTIAVVDEGLLGLTRYGLPNPRNTFYAREASFLKSWDLYQDIMGAYAGRLETLLAIGGGDDSLDEGEKESQRFKPVIRFFGPFELKSRETKAQALDLPPYIGALRIMVLAASSTKEAQGSVKSQRAYGTAEKSVKVSSDLMVFATIPRTLSPGDEAEIPVAVNSYKEGGRAVKVSLAVSGAGLLDGNVQNLVFDSPGEKIIRFRVKAPDLPGLVKFSVNAESSGLRTAHHETDLEVRSTAIPVSKSVWSLVAPGELWTGRVDFPGKAGSNRAKAEFSRLPPINLEARLGYLIAYPHGCVEQTTSAVFPQLYLDRVLTLDENKMGNIRSNIAAGIERLAAFQTSSGGFSYWPGDGEAHDWASSYAGHFLTEAARAGYAVPAELLKKWAHFQKNKAGLWSSQTRDSGEALDQAYRLYTLALAGEADLGSMNRLKESSNLSLQASWRLAAAYWYAGQRDSAQAMTRNLDTRIGEYRELNQGFGSALRDKAMILETLILLGDTGRTKPLFEEICGALASDSWLSTQETAYALIALTPYIKGSAPGRFTVDCSLGRNNHSLNFDTPIEQLDLGDLEGSSGTYNVRNRSPAPVYARIILTGLPEEGLEPTLSQGLAMTVEYRDAEGRIIDPETLKTGNDMEVRVKLRNTWTKAVPEIALVHPIPSSWELINYRLAGDQDEKPPAHKYQDIRDDRVMTYFDLPRDGETTVSFRVNKTYGGSYFRPAIHAYAMYDESIRALIPGIRVK